MGAPGAELLDDPCLPDPGLAADEYELCPAVLGRAPEGGQLRPLRGSPNERGTGELSALRADGRRFVLSRQ